MPEVSVEIAWPPTATTYIVEPIDFVEHVNEGAVLKDYVDDESVKEQAYPTASAYIVVVNCN